MNCLLMQSEQLLVVTACGQVLAMGLEATVSPKGYHEQCAFPWQPQASKLLKQHDIHS